MYLITLLLLFSLLLSECSATGEPNPVSLPIPFSGAMTKDSQLFVDNGVAIQTDLSNGEVVGLHWTKFDPTGNPQGTLFYDRSSERNIQQLGDLNMVTVTFRVDNGDGCSFTIESLQCLFFLDPSLPTTLTPQEMATCSGGESNLTAIVFTGVASGEITEATGSCSNFLGGVVEYRFSTEGVLQGDGSLIPCRPIHCTELLTPP